MYGLVRVGQVGGHDLLVAMAIVKMTNMHRSSPFNMDQQYGLQLHKIFSHRLNTLVSSKEHAQKVDLHNSKSGTR